VLLTGCSGLDMEEKRFMLDVGADFAGYGEYRPDYLVPGFETENGETAYVMHCQGMKLENVTGEVFARRQAPYFNRTWAHFSSHRQTPNDVSAELQPAAVFKGNVAYIGWNIFEEYATVGSLISKELVLHAVNRLLGEERTVFAGIPDRGVVTVTRQADEKREVVHLLFAHTTVRGKNVEVIEDAVPLYDVSVCLKRSQAPAKVYLAPQGEEISFTYENGRVKFTVPKVLLHQMVAVED